MAEAEIIYNKIRNNLFHLHMLNIIDQNCKTKKASVEWHMRNIRGLYRISNTEVLITRINNTQSTHATLALS